ncbi:MAG: leucyl aminopeptidase family protein [Alphaproteobacteria bacterium]
MPTAIIDQADAPIPLLLLSAAALEDWLAGQPAQVGAWLDAHGFKAKSGTWAALPEEDGTVARVLIGVGDTDLDDPPPALFRKLPLTLPEGAYRIENDLSDKAATAATLGWALGAYRFDRYQNDNQNGRTPANLLPPDNADASFAAAAADGDTLARDLINTPANDMGPEDLADAAQALAGRFGADARVIVGEGLLEANFPAIYEVGKGSDRAPRLIDFSWGSEDAPKVTLVGKGVVFDTGGYDLKPSQYMALMKKDMGGAAHVLGLAHMIMAMDLPVRLRVLIPSVENSVSGKAFRPSDVIASRKGLTIEIGNTDAEGRLVLADALALASEETPDLLIDMATLTGAARSALGPEVPPFFTDGDDLAAALDTAAKEQHDPLWRMPLWAPYADRLKSKIADISNDGGAFAGAITAALFLKRFVSDSERWVHFDIYAWNPDGRPGHPVGAEAMALRALFSIIRKKFCP